MQNISIMIYVQHECYLCVETKPDNDFVQFRTHSTDHCCRSCLVVWFSKGNLTCPFCREAMTMLDTIAISNAEQHILTQYKNSLIKMYKTQTQLSLDTTKILSDSDIDKPKKQQLYDQHKLSIDMTVALQLSVRDVLEAILQDIHDDDCTNTEFIGIEELYKLHKTRLPGTGTGHTLN